jgi:hypothetical protein
MLSTHLRLGLPSGLIPSSFPTNTLYTFLFPPIRATCPANLILIGLIILIILGEVYKSRSFFCCSILHRHVTSSLFGPHILLNTLFSNTLSLFSSLNVRDKLSHQRKNYNRLYSNCYVLRQQTKRQGSGPNHVGTSSTYTKVKLSP